MIHALGSLDGECALRQSLSLGPLRQQVRQRCPDLDPHLWPLDKLDQLRQWHPLGRDVPRFSSLAMGRDQPRAVLAIPEQQVVLLFVGRLELHAKAHPGVLLQALARVAERLALRLELVNCRHHASHGLLRIDPQRLRQRRSSCRRFSP